MLIFTQTSQSPLLFLCFFFNELVNIMLQEILVVWKSQHGSCPERNGLVWSKTNVGSTFVALFRYFYSPCIEFTHFPVLTFLFWQLYYNSGVGQICPGFKLSWIIISRRLTTNKKDSQLSDAKKKTNRPHPMVNRVTKLFVCHLERKRWLFVCIAKENDNEKPV